MAEQVEASVDLVNQRVQFTGTSRTNAPITMDYRPPVGDGQGYTGLELLLVSLAGCSGTTLAFLLRKMGKDVACLRVSAKGARREVHPMSLEKIRLEFVLTSRDAADTDVRKAIQLAEQTYCPVWAMLKGNVEIATEHRIIPGRGT
jgi:putative redox protein